MSKKTNNIETDFADFIVWVYGMIYIRRPASHTKLPIGSENKFERNKEFSGRSMLISALFRHPGIRVFLHDKQHRA